MAVPNLWTTLSRVNYVMSFRISKATYSSSEFSCEPVLLLFYFITDAWKSIGTYFNGHLWGKFPNVLNFKVKNFIWWTLIIRYCSFIYRKTKLGFLQVSFNFKRRSSFWSVIIFQTRKGDELNHFVVFTYIDYPKNRSVLTFFCLDILSSVRVETKCDLITLGISWFSTMN